MSSFVRSWKYPARGWIAVPWCFSIDSTSTPCWARYIAVARPIMLPPTTNTGTSMSASVCSLIVTSPLHAYARDHGERDHSGLARFARVPARRDGGRRHARHRPPVPEPARARLDRARVAGRLHVADQGVVVERDTACASPS